MDIQDLLNAFDNLLQRLRDGVDYEGRPPRPCVDDGTAFTMDDAALDAGDQDPFGEPSRNDIDLSPGKPKIIDSIFYEEFTRRKMEYPSEKQLDGLTIIGISGDNNRVLTPSFHLILARTASVNFKYTSGYDKPYFYTQAKDASSILMVDDNIFQDEYTNWTDNRLSKTDGKDTPLLDHLRKFSGKPLRFVCRGGSLKSSPASHSLGLGVKLQHTLELESLENLLLEDKGNIICLKDGPYLSNSVYSKDAQEGLQQLLSWSGKNRVFIAVSNKVADSKVLLNTFQDLKYEHLLHQYFPNQEIKASSIKDFGTDLLLLRKILKPGCRTPLIQYVEKTREGYFDTAALKKLLPLTCYYQKFNKPYQYIRIEVPTFMWEENQELVHLGIQATIWQLELGGDMPMVLKAAAEQAGNMHERNVIELQMKAAFEKKKLDIIEFLKVS